MKYEFTNNVRLYNNRELTQIRRISDGQLGGYIEKEENLSQDGDCWIDQYSYIYGNASILIQVLIDCGVEIKDNTLIKGPIEIHNFEDLAKIVYPGLDTTAIDHMIAYDEAIKKGKFNEKS